MRQANPSLQKTKSTRRNSACAQQDHIFDPYQPRQTLNEGTVCPRCGAVYHQGRWQWSARGERAVEKLCPACRRIEDEFPAGMVTLQGDFAREHKAEMIHLARHQEQAEKGKHLLNRIINIEENAGGGRDQHDGHRIGEAIQRALYGQIDDIFERDGYCVRVNWTRDA